MFEPEFCETMQASPADVNMRLFHQVQFHALAVESDDDPISLYKKCLLLIIILFYLYYVELINWIIFL